MLYDAQSIVTLLITNISLCCLFVALRCYVRQVMVGTFWFDDWLAVISVCFHALGTGFQLDGYYNHGNGRPLDEVPPPLTQNLRVGMRDLFISILFYIVSSGAIKISFALTLLRFVRQRAQLVVLKVTFAVIVVSSTYYMCFTIFECQPVSYLWDRFLDDYFIYSLAGLSTAGLQPKGHCANPSYVVRSTYTHSAALIAVDLVLGLTLPILLLKDLNMKAGLKILSGVLLSLGALASVATIVRFLYVHELAAQDPLFSANSLFVWSNIELSWCIIGTSCATLKPLAVKLRMVTDLVSKRSTAGSQPKVVSASAASKSLPASKSMFGSSSLGSVDVEKGEGVRVWAGGPFSHEPIDVGATQWGGRTLQHVDDVIRRHGEG